MRRIVLAPFLAALLLGLPTACARAGNTTLLPSGFTDLAFKQHPGATLPQDVTLRDSTGKTVTTGELFAAKKPLILVFDYFRCTTLCGVVLDDLAATMRKVPLVPGQDYGVVAVSIDPTETPQDAAEMRAKHFDRGPAFAGALRFLVGDKASVRRLADAAGFPYRYDAAVKQYAHPAGVVLLSPGGVVSRYILGIGYDPLDLRLGLVEASHGTIASAADQLLLLCYCYDPATGKYNAAVGQFTNAIGGVTVLAIGLFIFWAARGPKGTGSARKPKGRA